MPKYITTISNESVMKQCDSLCDPDKMCPLELEAILLNNLSACSNVPKLIQSTRCRLIMKRIHLPTVKNIRPTLSSEQLSSMNKNIMNTYYDMHTMYGFEHTDAHQSNILYDIHNDRVVFIDNTESVLNTHNIYPESNGSQCNNECPVMLRMMDMYRYK
jgi:hypothetical protein